MASTFGDIMDSRQQLEQMSNTIRQLVQQQEFAQALQILDEMLAIAPGINLLMHRGILLMRLERWQEAITTFVEVLKINPEFQIARENLKQARFMLQRQTNVTKPGSTSKTMQLFEKKPQVQTEQGPSLCATEGMRIGKRLMAVDGTMHQRFGRYQIIKEIGSGGMGKVYHAYDDTLKRDVALKTILQNSNRIAIQRFSREAKAMAKLSHPNIIKIYDVGVIDGVYYFTMELICGLPMSEWITREHLSVRRAVMLLHKISEAIDYAHQQGIIHRDIKPGNVIINEEGEPFVMDFGLARETQGSSNIDLSKSGIPIGTIKYMPPEQALGNKREIDERSDVYSLGAMFYELLTGKAPFQGTTAHVILLKVLEEEPIPAREISKKVPAEVEAICLKAMAKDKSRRYQSAHELSRDLQRFLNGEPVLASAPSLSYHFQKWISRNRLLSASVVIAVLIIIVGVIVALVAGENQIKKCIKRKESRVKRKEGRPTDNHADKKICTKN